MIEPNPSPDPLNEPETAELSAFQHPEWMVGIVLICGVLAIAAGLVHPVWWLTGSPCILALAIWIYGRVKGRFKRRMKSA